MQLQFAVISYVNKMFYTLKYTVVNFFMNEGSSVLRILIFNLI